MNNKSGLMTMASNFRFLEMLFNLLIHHFKIPGGDTNIPKWGTWRTMPNSQD